ncbi:MAG TPA: glycosyltransferase family 39 protein [Acidimicrobiia bacterium]|nr:glycosyltransferase family 39 protein [Acidimicrobiia bacterium]
MIGNLVWVARDHQAPPWDTAHYLHLSWVWRGAWDAGGIGRLVSAVYHTDPHYAPLYPLVITPFEALANGVHAALVANTILLAATVVTVAAIAARLYGRRAAFPAALFVATAPLVYGVSRSVLVEPLLIWLVAFTVWAALKSDGFRDRRWAAACGASFGLATLTKLTAPGILILPLALSLAWPARVALRRQLTNVAIAAAVAVAVALPWYAVNLGPSLDYLHSTTSGSFAIGLTTNPLSLHSFAAWVAAATSAGPGAILVVTTLVAAGLGVSTRRRPVAWDRRTVVRVAIPAAWFGVPFVAIAVSHNQVVRTLAVAVPGLAVLAAGAVAAIRPVVVRRVVLGLAAVLLAVQFVSYLGPFGFGGAALRVGPAGYRILVPFNGTSLSDTRRAGVPDYATPIVEALAAGRPAGAPAENVCLLETHEVVNVDTLGYVAESHGVDLSFTDLSYLPHTSGRQLAAALAACRVALYIPGDTGIGRTAVLNRSSAAVRATPAELAAFRGPRRSFPVGPHVRAQLLRRP